MSGRKTVGYENRDIFFKTFLLDELSIILAFFSAVIIRYNAIISWVDYNSRIYVSLIITAILFQIIIMFLYDAKKTSIVRMDPMENGIRLVKSRLLMTALYLVYLFVTQRSVLASRIVLSIFLLLSVVYGYLFRMLYRNYYIKNRMTDLPKKDIILDMLDPGAEKKLAGISEDECNHVLIIPEEGNDDRTEKVISKLENLGIRTYIALGRGDYRVRAGIVTDVDEYAAVPAFIRKTRFSVFGVNYNVGRIEEAVYHVLHHLEKLKGEYICFSNVHTSVMARENPEYANVLNSAVHVFPDGNPIVRLQKRSGLPGAERVAGPDFMANMFRDTQDGKVSHYFYGSREETLKALEKQLESRYPGINIKGMYSPPFRELTQEEDEEDIRRINESGADILWVGLGAPKQEKWMNAHKGRINAVMMGVGAGFDFHAGTIDRAPVWIQKIGFEWLYRLFQDPARLFKRYFVTNIKFFWYLLSK